MASLRTAARGRVMARTGDEYTRAADAGLCLLTGTAAGRAA